jgi:hypothetical protein
MNVKVEVITPETAAAYLATSTGNRPISRTRVLQYVSDMIDDAWELTHQSIAFDDDGVLIDGHHRLTAVTVANKPVTMLVTRGVAAEAYSTIDIGRTRTLADAARLNRYIVAPFRLAWSMSAAERVHNSRVLSTNAVHGLGASAVQALAMSTGGEMLELVHNLLGNRNLGVLTAPMRLAGMVRLHEGEDRDFICGQLVALARREYNLMTPTTQLLCRRIEMKSLSREPKLLSTHAMMLKVFDQRTSNLGVLKALTSETPFVTPRIRVAMDAFMAESGHHSVFSMNKE